MRLTPPTKKVFLITLALAVIGVLCFLDILPFGGFWFMTAAYVLLVLACLIKNL